MAVAEPAGFRHDGFHGGDSALPQRRHGIAVFGNASHRDARKRGVSIAVTSTLLLSAAPTTQ